MENKELCAALRRGVGNGDPASVRKAEELMEMAANEIESLDQQIWNLVGDGSVPKAR